MARRPLGIGVPRLFCIFNSTSTEELFKSERSSDNSGCRYGDSASRAGKTRGFLSGV